MKSGYTKLRDYFTLNTYFEKPTSWSIFMTQQFLIALVNTPQPHWNNIGLLIIKKKKILEMPSQVKLSLF